MKQILKKYIEKRICKRGKALDLVWMNVLGVISALNLSDEFILHFIEDAKNDKIFKNLNFLNGGNWVDEVQNPNYVKFLQTLFETCPKGLGTPNAACGEGELMLILASPKLKKPSKNDIQVENGEVFNLKNDKPRVFAGTDGKTLNKIMMNIAEKIGLKPQTHNGNKSIQLVNENFIINDWNKQFKKIEKSKIIDFLSIFLINLFPEKRLDDKYVNNLVTDCLNGNELVWDKWNKLLTVFIFEHGNDRDENLLSIKLDGTVKVIPNRVEIFKELVLMGRIIFDSGYFRMFQNGKVGIYIKFSDI